MDQLDDERTAPAKFERALVVANPIAGRGRAESAARELASGLAARGIQTQLHLTQKRGDGLAGVRAMGADVDLVAAVGGDGTLGEVLSGLGTRDVAVAQLPMGTANVLAKDARLATDVDGLIESVLGGRTTPLDIAEVNGRLSFLCVGIGFDGACVAEVERRRRGPISKLDYVKAGLAVLRSPCRPQLELEIDGELQPGTFELVLVSNVREYGAYFRLSSLARRDDQRVEVYALRRATRWQLLRLGLAGSFRELPGGVAEFWQASRVRVHAPSDTPWQVDGDLGGRGSIDYALSGTRRRLVVP